MGTGLGRQNPAGLYPLPSLLLEELQWRTDRDLYIAGCLFGSLATRYQLSESALISDSNHFVLLGSAAASWQSYCAFGQGRLSCPFNFEG
jgi:hypothetical protein